jgi:hypothetical protein
MITLEKMTIEYIGSVTQFIETGKGSSPDLEHKYHTMIELLNQSLDNLVIDVQKDDIGNRMGLLQTRLLLEFKDIIDCIHRLPALYMELDTLPPEKPIITE